MYTLIEYYENGIDKIAWVKYKVVDDRVGVLNEFLHEKNLTSKSIRQTDYDDFKKLSHEIMKRTMVVTKDNDCPTSFIAYDVYGNTVKCIAGQLTLKINGQKNDKDIGAFDKSGNYIKGSRNKLIASKHKMKSIKGWAINKSVLERVKQGKYIKIISDIGTFKCEVDNLKDSLMTVFSQKGYDVQVGIPDSAWVKQ